MTAGETSGVSDGSGKNEVRLVRVGVGIGDVDRGDVDLGEVDRGEGLKDEREGLTVSSCSSSTPYSTDMEGGSFLWILSVSSQEHMTPEMTGTSGDDAADGELALEGWVVAGCRGRPEEGSLSSFLCPSSLSFSFSLSLLLSLAEVGLNMLSTMSAFMLATGIWTMDRPA